MVKLNKIYTRTGDDGTTGLAGGERVSKTDLRVEAYGAVDEANSFIGVARLSTSGMVQLDPILAAIQNALFDLGADLASPGTAETLGYEPLRVTQKQVDDIEHAIDALNASLQPLKSFVLPGGSPASAHLHVARTVSRRAERLMVGLNEREHGAINPAAMRYINRLSDLLFVAARVANENGASDVLWIPGKDR
jgi:cob(I)alamin adenosyltransferase